MLTTTNGVCHPAVTRWNMAQNLQASDKVQDHKKYYRRSLKRLKIVRNPEGYRSPKLKVAAQGLCISEGASMQPACTATVDDSTVCTTSHVRYYQDSQGFDMGGYQDYGPFLGP